MSCTTTKYFFRLLTTLALTLLISSSVSAQTSEEFYNVRSVIERGMNWRQRVSERPVEEVEVALRREKGGNDTFVNLRFHGGSTFENQKRVYLKDSLPQKIIWKVGGEWPNGRDLTLSTYEGSIAVEAVIVRYQKITPAIPQPVQTTPSPSPSATLKKETVDPNAEVKCRDFNARTPVIQVISIQSTGGAFSKKYKAKGFIEGDCISEAGYYEYGRIVERIPSIISYNPQRIDFELRVRSGETGEIRAYTAKGKSEVIPIDEVLKTK